MRVLLPLTYSGGGAFGSQWSSDLFIHNTAPVPLRTSIGEIAPNATAQVPPVPRDGGSFVTISRGMERHAAFSSHIADRSRLTESAGTEVPVVRAEDTDWQLAIPNVPLDATRYRVTLRVYEFDGRRTAVNVRTNLAGVSFGGLLAAGSNLAPGFASFDLTANPRLPKSGTIDLHLAGLRGDRLWAVVSVTNNQTQQVTLYTPQGKTD